MSFLPQTNLRLEPTSMPFSVESRSRKDEFLPGALWERDCHADGRARMAHNCGHALRYGRCGPAGHLADARSKLGRSRARSCQRSADDSFAGHVRLPVAVTVA